MKRFLIASILTTLFLAAVTYMGEQFGWWLPPTYLAEILFFILFMTVLIFTYLNKLRNRQPELFSQFYLFSIVLKMLGGLALITFIVWDYPEVATGNVVLFIVSYLVLTLLEVIFLMKKSE